jgi:glycosyltransferase involved in cell wall biosynthesis
MRVSVIVPTFNGAWCLGQTLRSVQAQTLTDFEVIVIDDGSTDGTAQLARDVASADGRFRVLEQQNAGVAITRNRGIALAKGDYVAPLDQDDLWKPEFLAEAVKALDQNPAAVMAFARSVWIDADGRPSTFPLPEVPQSVGYRELLRSNPIGNGSCTVVRREALQFVGFDADLVAHIGQVDDWWTQLQLSWMGELIMIDAPLIGYRISAAATSQRQLWRMARGGLEVIRRARREGPALPNEDYAYARSMSLLWFMRRARAAGQWRLALAFAAYAYIINPLWFRERELRQPFVSLLSRPFRRRRGPGIWDELISVSRDSGVDVKT